MAIIVLLSCQKEELSLTNSKLSDEIDNVDFSDLALRGKKERVTVYCHFDSSTGRYVTKEVNERALKAHLGHGDLLEDPGECCSSEGLNTVTLPDGSTIYVQPANESIDVAWGPAASDVPDLVNHLTEAEALTDFDGWSNTKSIVKYQGAGDYAAKICADLVDDGGCDNWYLPSLGELRAMKEQGAISMGRYWSSTEQFPGFAWVESFLGTTNANKKERIDRKCLCVRR